MNLHFVGNKRGEIMRIIEIWKHNNYVLYIENEYLIAWHESTDSNYMLDTMGNLELFICEECQFRYMGNTNLLVLDDGVSLNDYTISIYDVWGRTYDIHEKGYGIPYVLGVALEHAIENKISVSGDFYAMSADEIEISDNLRGLINFYESVYPSATVKFHSNTEFEISDTEHEIVYHSVEELTEALADEIKEAIVHDMINWGDVTE